MYDSGRLASRLAAKQLTKIIDRRVIVNRIRLETFEANTTRRILYCTYIVFAIAIALTVILRLGVDRQDIFLPETSVNGCQAVDTFPPTLSSCLLPFPPNGTMWKGVVADLSTFDGKLQLISNPTPVVWTSQFTQSISYDVNVEAFTNEADSALSTLKRYPVASGVLMAYDSPKLSRLFEPPILTDSWQTIATLTNSTATLQCFQTSHNGPSCNPITLFDTDWISYGQGGGGGYSAYRLTVLYHGFNYSTFGVAVDYDMSYQVAAFRATDVGMRLACMVGTLFVIAWWLREMCRQMVVVEDKQGTSTHLQRLSFLQWLPQQRWVLYLLITTFFWQNPLYVAMQFLPSANVPLQLAFLSAIVEFGGWATLFTYWWTLVDGLKVPLDTLRYLNDITRPVVSVRRETYNAPPPPPSSSSSFSAAAETGSADVARSAVSAMPDAALAEMEGSAVAATTKTVAGYVIPSKLTQKPRLRRMSHVEADTLQPQRATTCCGRCERLRVCRPCCGIHVFSDPLSPYYGVKSYPTSGFAFYWPKITFLLLLCAFGTAVQLLAQPDLVFGQRGTSDNPLSDPTTAKQLLEAVVALGSLYIFLLVVWLVFFLWANITTKKQLERLPYNLTRYQQLSYRFFIFQQFVVVVYVVVVNLIPLFTVIQGYFEHPISADNSPNASFNVENQVASVIKSFTQSVTPIGELFIVSVYVFILAYCYAPPKHKQHAGAVGPSATEDESTPKQSALESALTYAPKQANKIGEQLTVIVENKVLGFADPRSHRFSLPTCCWLFDFANAVYFDANNVATPSSYGSITAPPHGFDVMDPIYEPTTDTYVWVCVRGNRIVVAFRGTCSQQNFNTDVELRLVPADFDNADPLANHIPGVRHALSLVHRGFRRAYASIRSRLQGSLSSALERVCSSSGGSAGAKPRVYMTGHSLGGALAVLAAYDLQPMIREFPQIYAAANSLNRRSTGSRRPDGAGVPRVASRDLRRAHQQLEALLLPAQQDVSAALPDGNVITFKAAEFDDEIGLERLVTAKHNANAKRPVSMQYQAPRLDSARRVSPRTTAAAAGAGTTTSTSARRAPSIKQPLLGESTRRPIISHTPAIEEEDNEPEDEATALAHMLLDDDVVEGADPLDCVGLPPDEDPLADLEFFKQEESAEDCVVVYTYGSPRVGNPAFARAYNQRIPYTFRVVFDGDFVSGVPRWLWDYKHSGVEIWLDEFGNHIVNPSFVEKTFRARVRIRLASHRMGSYRRGLIYARRNEGLTQFRNWAAAKAIDEGNTQQQDV